MEKNLFVNKFDKEFKNNEKVFYSKNNSIDRSIEKVDVLKKINEIFRSNDFVYKADVVITLENRKINTTIIARNNSSLITMDNEVIKINEILDIKKVV
mgnify:CR=1 FL=1